MIVKVIEMRRVGVELPRRGLEDRSCIRGDLMVAHTGDQGLRRPALLARLFEPGTKRIMAELVDPHIVWMHGERFVLTGFERKKNDSGQPVDYAQSWLCIKEVDDDPLESGSWKYGRQGRY